MLLSLLWTSLVKPYLRIPFDTDCGLGLPERSTLAPSFCVEAPLFKAELKQDAASIAEKILAKKLNRAREAGHVTDEHEAELTALDDDPQVGHALTISRHR